MTRLAGVLIPLSLVFAGCAGILSPVAPAAVTDGVKTMIVTSPLADSEFAAGQSLTFNIEIYDGDKLGSRGHAAAGGHYHVKLGAASDVVFSSDVPSFTVTLPDDLAPGGHEFRVEYHDSDGVSGRFFVRIPFRVAQR